MRCGICSNKEPTYQNRLRNGALAGVLPVRDAGEHRPNGSFIEWPTERQQDQIALWRAQGYAYAPPCDNIRTDGHCAGHERKE